MKIHYGPDDGRPLCGNSLALPNHTTARELVTCKNCLRSMKDSPSLRPIVTLTEVRSVAAPTALNIQVGGDHYKTCKIQPVEYIEANEIKFLEGCSIKRLTRHDKPTGKGAEDIRKVIHEMRLLLELRYGESGDE